MMKSPAPRDSEFSDSRRRPRGPPGIDAPPMLIARADEVIE